MNAEKYIELTAAIRGYHFYKRYWQPKEAERSECLHKVYNPIDAFEIKIVNSDKVITGHLSREISRATRFLLDREAVAYAKHSLQKYMVRQLKAFNY